MKQQYSGFQNQFAIIGVILLKNKVSQQIKYNWQDQTEPSENGAFLKCLHSILIFFTILV